MDIQNVVNSSTPSRGGVDGARVAVPATKAKTTSAVAEQKPPVSAKPDAASLQNAVDNINKSFKQSDTAMQFSVDRDTKRNVVKMMDSSTGEVIRQYPSEVALAISKAIDQGTKQGALLNQKA